jgi:hypothetical protein
VQKIEAPSRFRRRRAKDSIVGAADCCTTVLSIPTCAKLHIFVDSFHHGIPFFGHNEYPDSAWKEVFIHPRNAFGVLIQIAEFETPAHLSRRIQLAEETTWQTEKTENGANLVLSDPYGHLVSVTMERGEMIRLVETLKSLL